MTDHSPTVYLDASLTPNRSLSERGFLIVMVIVGIASFVTGMMFVALGAIPVIGFFGLDAVLFYFLFRSSFRKQREETLVKVTADTVELRHAPVKGQPKTVSLPTAFARVELDEPLTPNSWLRIEYGSTAYIIGRFLTPPERKSLAQAIRDAIARARQERY